MHGDHTQRKKDLDALAGQINKGIVENGCYVLEETGLAVIWGEHELDFERRLILQNFAQRYDFAVQYNSYIQTAIFRTLI